MQIHFNFGTLTMFKKSLFTFLIILLSSSFLMGCQSLKKKKGGAGGAGDMEEINGTFAQGSEDGTTYSDRAKCQVTNNEPGAEQHIFFEFDQSSVPSQFMAALQTQANYLNSHPNAKVKIEGNTDDRGSREYNVTLGWGRAKAVVDALQQHGVRKNQMVVTSFGAERPVAFGQTETAWRCNRRVDMIFQ